MAESSVNQKQKVDELSQATAERSPKRVTNWHLDLRRTISAEFNEH